MRTVDDLVCGAYYFPQQLEAMACAPNESAVLRQLHARVCLDSDAIVHHVGANFMADLWLSAWMLLIYHSAHVWMLGGRETVRALRDLGLAAAPRASVLGTTMRHGVPGVCYDIRNEFFDS